MRFVIYGAGAVGGVVGGRLFVAGYDVVLIARGEHATALRTQGLRLESPLGSSLLAVPVVEHPREVGWRDDDVIVLSLKSQHTAVAADSLAGLVPEHTPVVSMQNGVSNERALVRWFENVYGCCVMCPTSHLEPGIVSAYSSPTSGILDLGRFPTGVDDKAVDIAAALARSTFIAEPRPDIMRWKYRKLVLNLGNVVQALCDTLDREGELIALLKGEALRCFEAASIDAVSEADDRARRGDHLQIGTIGEQPRAGGSSWQSLRRGAGSIETDHLNGEITRLGRLYGVPTPANVVVQSMARRQAGAHRPPGEMTEAGLLHLVAQHR